MTEKLTTRERVAAQRKARLDAGWVEIRLWAASAEDAEKVRRYGEKLRIKTLQIPLRKIGAERGMDPALVELGLGAIRNQESDTHNTPSGATLDLMSHVLRTGDLNGVVGLFAMFSAAHPANADFVAKRAPAKLLNHYLLAKLDLHGPSRFQAWSKQHPNWAEQVSEALIDGTLEAWTQTALAQLCRTTP